MSFKAALNVLGVGPVFHMEDSFQRLTELNPLWEKLAVLAPVPKIDDVPIWPPRLEDRDDGREREARAKLLASVLGLDRANDAETGDAPASPFTGDFEDPNHPGCLRQVKMVGPVIEITGYDGNGSEKACTETDRPACSDLWKIQGTMKSNSVASIDFSPKGGPAGMTGTWNMDGIVFSDGNKWTKIPGGTPTRRPKEKCPDAEADDGKDCDRSSTSDMYHSNVDFPLCLYFMDMLEAYRHAFQNDSSPAAPFKVVLTSRETGRKWAESALSSILNWHPSRRKFGHEVLFSTIFKKGDAMLRDTFFRYFPTIIRDDDESIEMLAGMHDSWNEYVRTSMRDYARANNLELSDIFLDYQVKEGWDPLCKFLNIGKEDCPNGDGDGGQPFPHINEKEGYKQKLRQVNMMGYVIFAAIVGIPLLIFYFVRRRWCCKGGGGRASSYSRLPANDNDGVEDDDITDE